MLAHILQRFRFRGVPGAPAAAAVPRAGGVDAIERELAPVFLALDEAQAEVAALVDAARRDALTIHREALEAGSAILASARQEEARVRAEAVAQVMGAAEAERGALLENAAREAEEAERRAETRLDELVHEIVEAVLDLGTAGGAMAPQPGP